MGVELSTYAAFKRMSRHDPNRHVLSQQELRQVQTLLLLMMDDIHRVCEEQGLQYVMSGGGALGAVRHGGFIPWDDDLDICLPRKDYDRFRQCMMEAFPGKYYIQEVRSCERYDLHFMKIRLNGTLFCETQETEPEKAGLFIDVFAVENTQDGALRRRMQRVWADGMQFVCSCIRIRKKRRLLLEMAKEDREAARSIRVKSCLAIPFCLVPFRRWLLMTERVLGRNHNDQSRYVAIPAGAKHFTGELYPREWVFPGREVEFEDRHYYTFGQVERYLTQLYGDYQTIPPEENREKHALLRFSLGDWQKQDGE